MNRDRLLRDIIPALLWMAVIFTLSTRAGSATRTDSSLDTFLAHFFPGLFHRMTWPELDALHYDIRKAAHVTEYAVLGVLMIRALRTTRTQADLRVFGAAWTLCALYAATDEFHQVYVPGRTPKATDVLIDACGAALGVAVAAFYARRQRSKHGNVSSVPFPKETV